MTETIVIIGGDAGARIAYEIFHAENPRRRIAVLDCFVPSGSWKEMRPDVLKGKKEDEENLALLKEKNVSYFVATGDNAMRREITEFLIGKTGKHPANCIHPSAVISPSAKMGNGNLLCPLAVVHTHAVIGNSTIINTGAVIEHDCTICDYAQISPNVALAGRVIVEESAFVATSATVIPHITVGKESLVAAGAVVTNNVPPRTMVAGCPATPKKTL
jgi:acetyltransferase EpsM